MTAKRDPLRPMGHTVFDAPPDCYRFERFAIESPHHRRRWRVTLGVPAQSASPKGFDAFWMLDGNAALMELDAALLTDLASAPAPPVLVFVSHDSDLRTDPARWRDYPFSVLEGEEPLPTHYRGGGAEVFLNTLERQAHPAIARRVALGRRQTLWGHSLGGLLTLYTLYSRPSAFTHYAAASPSLWWHDGALLDRPERDFICRGVEHTTCVRITQGGAERARDNSHRDLSDPKVQAHLARIASVPADAALRLAKRLARLPQVEASYREFPDLGHGPALRASLLDALEWGTGAPVNV